MIGTAKLAEKVADGKAKMEGNPLVLSQLGSTMVKFDNWFEVLPGTRKEVGMFPNPELLQDDATYYEGP